MALVSIGDKRARDAHRALAWLDPAARRRDTSHHPEPPWVSSQFTLHPGQHQHQRWCLGLVSEPRSQLLFFPLHNCPRKKRPGMFPNTREAAFPLHGNQNNQNKESPRESPAWATTLENGGGRSGGGGGGGARRLRWRAAAVSFIAICFSEVQRSSSLETL